MTTYTHSPRQHARLLFQAQTLLECVHVNQVFVPNGKHHKPILFDVRRLIEGIDEAGYHASLIMRARVFDLIARYDDELDGLRKDSLFWADQWVAVQQLKGLFI